MIKESDPKGEKGIEPFMNRHKPASEKTQDISHLLASIFKDVYTAEVIGKDAVGNLTKSHKGGNDHHSKYVEELQQVHSKYNSRIQDADMVEKHIVQARLKASVTEEHMRSQLREEGGENYHQLGLPPVRSAFAWCVDNELLKSHNLIYPQDYITEQAPVVKAPKRKSVPGFFQPTVSYTMHTSTQPQDDGYTLIPEPATAESLLEESEETLTLSSSQETFSIRTDSSQKVRQVPKPLGKDKPSLEDSAALQKFKQCQNFLRNPHFQPLSHQRGGKSLIMPEKRVGIGEKQKKERSSHEDPVPIFIPNPPVVLFTDYQIGGVYETTVELRNVTAASRHVRVIPPTTPHFSISLGENLITVALMIDPQRSMKWSQFPGDGGVIAPGMSCQYTVRFAPDSLANYEDFLVVETQSPNPLIIPLEAHRPPPILTLPAVLDLGYCLVGGVMFMNLLCRNDGYSAGTFCIMPKRQWPASSLRSAVKGCFAEEPPFAISPSLFHLLPGQAEVMQIVFFPKTAESFAQTFTIVCDNCQVKDFSIQGTGQLVMLELVAVEGGEDAPAFGEMHDLTADHLIRFEPTNVHSVLQKKVMIKNNTHLELPFHWRIMKPNMQCLLPGETPDPSCIQHHVDTDNAFSISPASGLLAPAQECVFLLTYSPNELREYHSVCHLVMTNIPNLQNFHDNSHASQQSDSVSDVIAMELEVKGTTEPYRILLEPYALFIPGEHYTHTTIRKRFKMWNHSKSAISFQWESISDCHSLHVEPSVGDIDTNECCDMELVVTGGRPGCLTTTLHCHIQHHPDPVVLPIEVMFKGPELSVNVPSVDLGLVELGKEVSTTLQIINSSPLEAQWSLEELPPDPALNQGEVRAEPGHGVLPPSSSCSVNVIFRAVCCQSFESVLKLVVLDGTGCHLPVQAEVQSPQVCLLDSHMVLPDLYVGVAQSCKATLFNQTLLPAHFKWNKLQGPQAHLCSASFTPSSGTVKPHEHMEIIVSFTSYTDEELTEVVAVCDVEGMERPLELSFHAKAKGLSVSYSLSQTDRAVTDVTDEQPVVLDFTKDEPVFIGKSTTRQLLITNHTAIPTSFHLQAETFHGHRPTESVNKSKYGDLRVNTPFHVMHSKKIEEKEYKDFVHGFLTHGKGLAFQVDPEKGTLDPFKAVVINITAHSDMWGDYEDHLMCKVGDLDPTLIPMRISVRGCPIYFQMIGPQAENQNQGPIIRFGTHISEGDTVSRSLRLNNTSPYDIRLDWLTYNKEPEDKKLIDLLVSYGEPFPLKDVDGNVVVRGPNTHMAFLPRSDQSQTPSTEGSSSALRSSSESSCEEEERGVSPASSRKLISVFIQPHEGCASDYPYCITPQQIVVPAGGSSTIHVSFTPLTLSDPGDSHTCVGYALGYMSLDSEVAPSLAGKVTRAEGYELEPLRLDMLAYVKPAILTVQMMEDEDTLEFSAAASDLLDGHTLRQECVTVRTLQLINHTDIPLSFTLSIQWPFSVLQHTQRVTASSPLHTHSFVGRTERQHTLLLPPKHNMQVKVALHLSASLLTYQSERCREALPTVTLLCGDSGERRLRFQQSLTIQYSNNSVQSIPLGAHLALPTLHLSSDSVDFGTCYVGQTTVKEVYLSNRGGSSSFWTVRLDAEKESKVFRVSPEHGLLDPVEYPISSSRQALEISFTPRDQDLFQTTVTVQGILGEPCLTLQIQGRGSFDERYASQTSDT